MNNQFSENLKKIRKEHHLSQEQLADELGVSRQAISKWESAAAYPEMEKIIALCTKFELNIDDLLHGDIAEIKKEEESKKSLNKALDDFLNYITDSINLFSNLSLGSKIKCLLEQIIIIIILTIISVCLVELGSSLLYDLLIFLPNKIRYFINSLFTSILILLSIIFSLVVLTHVFKIRYLDYYNKLKEESKEEIVANAGEEPTFQNKKFFNKERKIIIREPKHSEYRFINTLFKLIIGISKIVVLFFVLFICLFLVFMFMALVLSFLLYKTGILFIGLLITILSIIIITIIILLVNLNYVFNRKNAKKKMIWTFIASLGTLGCGVGLILVGTLNFELVYPNNLFKDERIELAMTDDMYLDFGINNIEYVEDNIENIRIEYKINKYCKLSFYRNHANPSLNFWAECSNPLKLTKEIIQNLNNKQIILINNNLKDIVIYASKENIEKLKINENKYYQQEENNLTRQYEEKINELENELTEYEIKINDYEDTINYLNGQIQNYEDYKASIENE